MNTRPPNIATVEVSIDAEACKISSQTATKTCNLPGRADPENIVCQEPSHSGAKKEKDFRKIEWTSSTAFTLEFNSGNPFKKNSGKCKLDVASKQFTCLIRKQSQDPPLQPDYKYAIVVNADCRLDPRVYLMR